ncbi:MAG: hypothetical protein V4717_21395 [Bacteroidota bacterium]
MTKNLLLAWWTLAISTPILSQGVSLNTTQSPAHESAMLDVSSNNRGLLIPRLTKTERDAIQSPATALLIFNADSKQFQVNTGTSLMPVWQTIVSVLPAETSTAFWQTGGNKNLVDSSFIGSSDSKSLSFKTNSFLRLYIDSVNTKIGIGTNTPRTSLEIATTDALIVPVGTTGQRPATPVVGMIRFNSNTNKLEGFTTTGWVALH